MPRLYVGTSGWMYDGWREGWYGKQPKRAWLAFDSTRFTAVEVDASFYRQQKPETFQRWASEVPEQFGFAVRGHRYLTHNKKLLDVEEPLQRVMAQAEGLGPKLKVMLWQLPPFLGKNLERLESFGKALQGWSSTRHAMEFRHKSWFSDDVAEILSRYCLVNTQSDAGKWELWPAVTTDVVYVRLHGKPDTYASRYEDDVLDSWARRIEGWLDEKRSVHVYFDNDIHGHAPHDAVRLLEKLSRFGNLD